MKQPGWSKIYEKLQTHCSLTVDPEKLCSLLGCASVVESPDKVPRSLRVSLFAPSDGLIIRLASSHAHGALVPVVGLGLYSLQRQLGKHRCIYHSTVVSTESATVRESMRMQLQAKWQLVSSQLIRKVERASLADS